MKNASIILSSLALVGVLVVLGIQLSGNKKNTAGGTGTANTGGHLRIAYVNIDTLEANYTYLKDKKAEFAKRQAAMEAELQRSAQQMQNSAEDLQRKYQAGTLTPTEAEASQKRLVQMKQSLDTRSQSLQEQLLKEQEAFNKDLKNRLNTFLETYNKDKNYDFIYSYTEVGSQLLYVNKSLDITQDVIGGMNKMTTQIPDTTSKRK